MSDSIVKVGLIGCGNISDAYFNGCKHFSDTIKIVACADIERERAEAKAKKWGIPLACDVPTLLAVPDIEIVINLTIPKAHAEVALAALDAGKSIYNEKPLALEREDAKRMLAKASEKGLRVGGAPDTFLGAGIQTCRKLIDDGAIGRPVAATGFFMGHGPEGWHPNPDFFYQPGAGPVFDMGPYYLTTLVVLLGAVKRVSGSAQISFPERLITSQPHHGEVIHVNTPTHVAGTLDFASGVVGTLVMSFDVWATSFEHLTIYGSEGTLSVPDPNTFGGPIRLLKNGEWKEIPLNEYPQPGRGTGVADMARAIRTGRKHRASGELAYHALDLMHSFADASQANRCVFLESSCERPEPLALIDPKEAILL